jgi:toxin ParE1/3/4
MEEVVLHSEARAELRDAAAYYEGCRSGLGKEFLTAAEATSAFVHAHPKMGHIVRTPYRRFLIRRFPYGLIYRRMEDTTYVVAVMHLKQNRVTGSRERGEPYESSTWRSSDVQERGPCP